MNILLVAPFVNLSNCIADSTHVFEIANNLSRLGNSVYVIAQKESSFNNAHIFDQNVKFINVRVCSSLLLNRILCLIYSFFVSAFYVLFCKIDIIYERHLIISIGLICGMLFRKKVVTEVNGIGVDELNLQGIVKRIYITIEDAVFKSTNLIIVVTSNIKEYLVDMHSLDRNKIYVFENGVNTEIFKPYDKKLSQNRLGFDNNYSYVCFVGNLAPWQGIEYLIDASPYVIKENKVKFVIVGDGVLREKLKDKVCSLGYNDYFIFVGKVPYNEVPYYINASDVCVVPKIKSLSSGYSPLKIYEYLACGKAVVATRAHGFEFVESFYTGILVNPENPLELSTAITKLVKNINVNDIMAKNGLEYVRKNNTWKRVAENIMNLLNLLVQKETDM